MIPLILFVFVLLHQRVDGGEGNIVIHIQVHEDGQFGLRVLNLSPVYQEILLSAAGGTTADIFHGDLDLAVQDTEARDILSYYSDEKVRMCSHAFLPKFDP